MHRLIRNELCESVTTTKHEKELYIQNKNYFTNNHLSWFHTGRQANLGDDSGKIWTLILQIHFVVKMDKRLHYVSLTAHKRKQGRVPATREISERSKVSAGCP